MVDLNNTLLGQNTDYVDRYSPGLLYPLPRKVKRDELGVNEQSLPFSGVDYWNSYELSWLSSTGKPRVAIATFAFPCNSKNIIESKSFKLYLNSLNQTRFDSNEQLEKTLIDDLSKVAGSDVRVNIVSLGDSLEMNSGAEGRVLIDDLEPDLFQYEVDPTLLSNSKEGHLQEKLISHLLKTNCPVTGQPDWASVLIDYSGDAISHEGLLRYIVSYRNHQDFHEQCVERMFMDIMRCCKPDSLTVYARYTRRGGLDINPLRSTDSNYAGNIRLSRQ